MNDWSSGIAAFIESHPDASEEEIRDIRREASWNFDARKFAAHYNNLSVKEWKKVVLEMAHKGYDIRSALCYKSLYGARFDIRLFDEIWYPLLDVDGARDLVHRLDGAECACGKEREKLKQSLVDLYSKFELPIPKYWRDVLWC